MIFIILFYGYSSFRPWSVQNFFIYYTMLILGKQESSTTQLPHSIPKPPQLPNPQSQQPTN